MVSSKEIILQTNTLEKKSIKTKERMGCEAKEHNPRCPCFNCQKPRKESCKNCPTNAKLTNQHKIPRCAKNILKWSWEQINDPSNKEYLSWPCHVDADKNISKQHRILEKEARGGRKFTPEEIMPLFRQNSIKNKAGNC